jgi:hypothetical protein
VGTLIPPGSLAVQRRVNRTNLEATAQVQTGTDVDDGSGGFTRTWANSGDPLPCRLGSPTNGRERLSAERVEELSQVLVVFAGGTDIPLSQRLVLSWDDNGTTKTATVSIIGRDDLRSYRSRAAYLCQVIR